MHLYGVLRCSDRQTHRIDNNHEAHDAQLNYLEKHVLHRTFPGIDVARRQDDFGLRILGKKFVDEMQAGDVFDGLNKIGISLIGYQLDCVRCSFARPC